MLKDAEGLLGRTIEDYQLIRVLGRGGMSLVLLGQSLHDPHDQVAIKVLKPSLSSMVDDNASFQARFRREAKTIHHLRQEHIVPVLSYGETEDLVYMVMPLIDGGTLASRLAMDEGPVPFPEIVRYLSQLASALDYAHQHGIVHRDIKPSNVLLDKQGNVYLADFGIARLFDSALADLQTGPTSLTMLGEIFGTPAYIAPERFVGEQAGPPADIYALGVVLYLLVTGQVPFEAETPLALGMKHINEPPLSPRALRADLPLPAEAAILRALAKEPADRFASAGALAQAFEAGLRGVWTPGLVPPELPSEGNPTMPISTEQSAQPVADPLPVSSLNSRPALIASPRSERRRWVWLAGLLATGVVLLSLLLALLLNGQRSALPKSPSTFTVSTIQRTVKTPANTRTGGTVQPSPGQQTSGAPGGITISVNKQTVFAIRNSDGVVLWRNTVNGQIISPLVNTGGVIYVVTVSGTVYAFQESNGHLLWSNDIGKPVNTPLTFTNGIVYVSTSNGYTYELNAQTGQVLATITPTPVVMPTSGTTPTPTPGVTPTPGITPTPTPGNTPTPKPGITPTPTPGNTPTPTPGITPTPTPTPDNTPTPTSTSQITPTPTPGETPSSAPNLVATKTPLPTPQESPTTVGTSNGKQS